MEATYIHVHSSDKTWKKGTRDLLYKNPYFFVIIWPNQMGSSLNCREIVMHGFIIRFDFCDFIKGSFAIDTQMPVVIFLGTIGRRHFFLHSSRKYTVRTKCVKK